MPTHNESSISCQAPEYIFHSTPTPTDIEGVSIGQKYQQRNVFTSNGDNDKKISLKLVKFQKRSLKIIFSKTYLFDKIL